MVKVFINDKAVEADDGMNILQACEKAGFEIPRFCYHERLSIAGNCRMCLVEVEGSAKPVASCAAPVSEGMKVSTQSPLVTKAREGVLEFLLINHPLDCPVCDEGGECDLQDQAMAYGVDGTRFAYNKRAVEEKYMGPIIKTVMTRCIQCTRCVRFATEVAGVPEIGAIGRGENMEITTYLERAVTSELSGNVIDLCPVGALTAKPYALRGRGWELEKFETIDVMDAVGSNIRMDVRNNKIMRILPCASDDINEEWISDKTRFAWDGLARQRLDQPYVRKRGKLQPASWDEAFARIARQVKKSDGGRIAALAGDMVCVESMKALSDLMDALQSPHKDCRQDGAALGGHGQDGYGRAGYLFNSTIAGIEMADALVIIGAYPRHEASILNARIRKRWLRGNFPIAFIGADPDNSMYAMRHLGTGPADLRRLVEGEDDFFDVLERAEKPMLILGQGALGALGALGSSLESSLDGAAVFAYACQLAKKTAMVHEAWNGFNVLHTAAARVGGLDIGFLPKARGYDTRGILRAAHEGALDMVYLLGVDEIAMESLGKTFVVYQGSHGDAGAKRADVVLPGASYAEKNALWVNTEGRVQETVRVMFPPKHAKEDWTILRALSEFLRCPLPYDTLQQLRAAIVKQAPHFGHIGDIVPAAMSWSSVPSAPSAALKKVDFTGDFTPTITRYYATNPIARASEVMRLCQAMHGQGQATQGQSQATQGQSQAVPGQSSKTDTSKS